MTFVKPLISYFLFLIVLLYVTPLQQLLKIPVLLEHFNEHKRNKPGITLTEFIFMHYVGDDGTADDDSRDMELPFKKSNIGQCVHDVYSTPVQVFVSAGAEELVCRKYSRYKKQYFPDACAGSLLKPPNS